MILTGNQIYANLKSNDITIEPFVMDNISTNSYDLTLGEKYIRYLDPILDPMKDNKFAEFIIPDDGLVLNKGDFILAESLETIGSDKFVPIIHGKSGVARKGLFAHITANLVDIGYKGKITLQLYATQNVIIHKGMKIAQVTFWVAKGEITLYNGKYQNGIGPQASKIFMDDKK
jgi:dCTP deaminase